MRSVSYTGDACRYISKPAEEETYEVCSQSLCDEIDATSAKMAYHEHVSVTEVAMFVFQACLRHGQARPSPW